MHETAGSLRMAYVKHIVKDYLQLIYAILILSQEHTLKLSTNRNLPVAGVKRQFTIAISSVLLLFSFSSAFAFDADEFAGRYKKQLQSKSSVRELADFVNQVTGPEFGLTGNIIGFANDIGEAKYLNKLYELSTMSQAQWDKMPASFQRYSLSNVKSVVSEVGDTGVLSNINDMMSNLGTALTAVSVMGDVIGALQGDDAANLNAMKTVIQYQMEILVKAFDSTNLNIAMTGVAVISYALDKFISNTMQQYEDYWWNAYVYYMEGRYPSPLGLTLLAHQHGPGELDRVLQEFWNNAEVNAGEYFQATGGNRPANYRNITGALLEDYKKKFAAQYYKDFLHTTMKTYAIKSAETALLVNSLAAESTANKLSDQAEKLAFLQQLLAALPDNEQQPIADIEKSIESCEFKDIEIRIAALEDETVQRDLFNRLSNARSQSQDVQDEITRTDNALKACRYSEAMDILREAQEYSNCPDDLERIKQNLAFVQTVEEQRARARQLLQDADALDRQGRTRDALTVAQGIDYDLQCDEYQNAVQDVVKFFREKAGFAADGERMCPGNAEIYWNQDKNAASCRCIQGYQPDNTGTQCIALQQTEEEAAAEMVGALFESFINMAGESGGNSNPSRSAGSQQGTTPAGCGVIRVDGNIRDPRHVVTMYSCYTNGVLSAIDIKEGSGNYDYQICNGGKNQYIIRTEVGDAVQRARSMCPNARVTGFATSSPAAVMSACDNIPGIWSWFNGGNVTFYPNGSLVQGPRSGSWSCSGTNVTISWSHGFQDRLILSDSGRNMRGRNQNGTVISGNRIGSL